MKLNEDLCDFQSLTHLIHIVNFHTNKSVQELSISIIPPRFNAAKQTKHTIM